MYLMLCSPRDQSLQLKIHIKLEIVILQHETFVFRLIIHFKLYIIICGFKNNTEYFCGK